MISDKKQRIPRSEAFGLLPSPKPENLYTWAKGMTEAEFFGANYRCEVCGGRKWYVFRQASHYAGSRGLYCEAGPKRHGPFDVEVPAWRDIDRPFRGGVRLAALSVDTAVTEPTPSRGDS